MSKRVPLDQDLAFRDLNWDFPLNKDWDSTLQDGLENEEWDDEQEWDHYSGLPSPLAYQRRAVEKKLEREYDDDSQDDDNTGYRPGKDTYSDSLEDEE